LQAAESQTGLITGIVNYNFETQQAFNTMLGLGVQNPDDAQAQYYYGHNNRFEKHHLLMIGEFIPFEDWLRGLAPIFDLPMSSFTRGDYLQANLLANGQYFSAALCFEIVFPRQVRANVYSHTDFLITLSNDAWFGNSHGPDQHMQIAQVRAKELGLPLVRSTNNGISGFVDHKGQMLSQLPQFEDGVLQQSMQKMSGTTPYRHFGDLLMWLIFIGFFVLAWWKLPNTAFR
jgi:apolipoprotein N-acyltransferase